MRPATAAYALAAGDSAMSRHDFLAAGKYYTKGLESADGGQSELYARLCFAMANALRWRLVRPLETEDLIRTGADILIRLENTNLLIESMRKLRMYSVRFSTAYRKPTTCRLMKRPLSASR